MPMMYRFPKTCRQRRTRKNMIIWKWVLYGRGQWSPSMALEPSFIIVRRACELRDRRRPNNIRVGNLDGLSIIGRWSTPWLWAFEYLSLVNMKQSGTSIYGHIRCPQKFGLYNEILNSYQATGGPPPHTDSGLPNRSAGYGTLGKDFSQGRPGRAEMR